MNLRASSWTIETGSDRQRRMVATQQTIPAGQIIVQEDAYAWVLDGNDNASRFCDCCLTLLPGEGPTLRCSACKRAHYVNREHQAKAWKHGHKQECEALKSIAPRFPGPTVLLAMRTVLTAHRNGELGGGSPSTTPSGGDAHAGHAGVLSLLSHWETFDDDERIKFAQLGALAWQLLGKASPSAAELVTPRDMAFLIARFACNLHTIADEELNPLGFGIYPLISKINHSCTPNAVQSFEGSKMTIRAIHDIIPGEEICIAYVELAATRWERRVELFKGYSFDLDSGLAQPEREFLGGALPCTTTVAMELHEYCPWRADDRDAELTAVLLSPSQSSAMNGVQWGMWGQVMPNDSQDQAAQSFGLDSDGPSSAETNKHGTPSNEDYVLFHVWGIKPGDLPLSTVRNLVLPYAQGLRTLQAAEEPLTAASRSTILNQLQAVVQSVSNGPLILGPKHVMRIRLLAAIMRLAIADASFKTALQVARDLLPLYTFVYPPAWPNLGLHHAALAKLEHYCGDLKAAAEHAHRAMAILETGLMGGGRAVVAELNRIRREAAGEHWEATRPQDKAL